METVLHEWMSLLCYSQELSGQALRLCLAKAQHNEPLSIIDPLQAATRDKGRVSVKPC